MADALATELETYKRLLSERTLDQGRYVLIAGEKHLGSFDTYHDALTAGYAARGLEPFLVKQVAAIEIIHNFSRDLRSPCLTSAI